MDNHCVDCGRPTSGVRCRVCNGRYTAEQAARQAEQDDRALVALVDDEKLSVARVGVRLGISRQAANRRVRKARSRLALLDALPG